MSTLPSQQSICLIWAQEEGHSRCRLAGFKIQASSRCLLFVTLSVTEGQKKLKDLYFKRQDRES